MVMHSSSKLVTASAIVAAISLAAAGPAAAKCQKMGFLVNDYGKDGPTKDAQDLLDKHIVKWAAEQGITKYTVSKKDVKCELFLDFVVFDEHTCTAEATVCWNEPAGSAQQAKKSTPSDTAAPAKPAKATAAATEKSEAPAKKSAEDDAKVAVPAVAPSKQVETGTVAPAAAPAAVSAQDAENAEKAAAAAERAAAAAERAAQAAERAAQAAEDLASSAPVQKYAAPAAVVPQVTAPEKEKTVAPVPPR